MVARAAASGWPSAQVGVLGYAADISVLREPSPGDAIVERNGVKLFLPAESRILLDGVTIDFADTASQTGLVFHDPKGSSCSSSGGKPVQ